MQLIMDIDKPKERIHILQDKNKHAYLIMCHTNFHQLNILLELLDDARNDIYLHIDKKSNGFSAEQIQNHVSKAKIYFISPITVGWGGDSQIKAEVRLLREAVKSKHQYYHLISGMDLPLKTQDEIHRFFNEHSGTDFVAMERNHPHNINKQFMERLEYYYIYQNRISDGDDDRAKSLVKKQEKCLTWQKKHHINRIKDTKIDFIKGCNWFSITQDAACYVLHNYKKFKSVFRYAYCAEEIFLQTILANSPFVNNIEDDCLRLIDWDRRESNAHPRIFREEDFELLTHAGENKLFARKFDEKTDSIIIDKMYRYLKSQV